MLSANRATLITKRAYNSRVIPIDITSKDGWRNSLKNNTLLNKLHQLNQNKKILIKPHTDETTSNEINSNETLPITCMPIQTIAESIKNDNSIGNWRKPLVKWIRVGKFLLSTYRSGLKFTWSTYFETKSFKYTPKELIKLIEFKETESRILKKNKMNELAISRREYLQWLRRAEFWKIPKFALTLLVFEELTPLLCYLFPYLAPWNCLTPGLYKKITASRNKRPTQDFDINKKYISPYEVDKKMLSEYLVSQCIVPAWKMRLYWITNEYRIPLLSLVEVNHKTIIDDWLLLREFLKSENEVATVISDKEIVDAVFRRQLYTSDEDLNKMVQDMRGQEVLKLRLLIYLAFKYDCTLSAHDINGQLLAEKWGVDNMATFNYRGSNRLLTANVLDNLESNDNSP